MLRSLSGSVVGYCSTAVSRLGQCEAFARLDAGARCGPESTLDLRGQVTFFLLDFA